MTAPVPPLRPPHGPAMCQHCDAVIEALVAAPDLWIDKDGSGTCLPGLDHKPMPAIPPLEAA